MIFFCFIHFLSIFMINMHVLVIVKGQATKTRHPTVLSLKEGIPLLEQCEVGIPEGQVALLHLDSLDPDSLQPVTCPLAWGFITF